MNLANPPTNATTREASRRLLIIGASARAAAHSAKRAGYIPLAIDRFNDLDLATACEQVGIYDRLRDIPRLASEFPGCDWLYSGPLENHPQLLRQLSSQRRLLGSPAEVVERVRDPWILEGELNTACFNLPHVVPRGLRPASGCWLKKPLRSGGGGGIVDYAPTRGCFDSLPGDSHNPVDYYFQQYIKGTPHSAVFIGARGSASLIGVTEQLVGSEWHAAGNYQYAGSAGPIALSNASTNQLRQLGQDLAERFHLSGLFGVDFILSGEEIWLVEVNPRYTASVEVIERTTGTCLTQAHVDACDAGRLPETPQHSCAAAKLIAYAPQRFSICEKFDAGLFDCAAEVGAIVADRPRPAIEIGAGEPICTFIIDASTAEQAKDKLMQIRMQTSWKAHMDVERHD